MNKNTRESNGSKDALGAASCKYAASEAMYVNSQHIAKKKIVIHDGIL